MRMARKPASAAGAEEEAKGEAEAEGEVEVDHAKVPRGVLRGEAL